MDFNFFNMALLGLLILFIMGLITNTGEESTDRIEQQLWFMNCPSPIYNGVASGVDFDPNTGFGFDYNVTHAQSTTSFNGTFFQCDIDNITGAFQVSVIIKPYDNVFGDCDLFCLPYGYFAFISDSIGNVFTRVGHALILFSFFLTPTNFNILGFGLEDIGGIALIIIIAIYGFSYIFIGLWLYKVISPFAGGGA